MVCKTYVYRARLKGGGLVALILFLAVPGCSLANSHAFLPISVVKHNPGRARQNRAGQEPISQTTTTRAEVLRPDIKQVFCLAYL